MGGAGGDARRLKLKTRELVRACGGIECAAGDLGKGKSTVHRWTDPNDDEHFLNVADCALLEAVAGEPIVTQTLCRLNGGVFVPLPDCAADPDTLAGMVMQLSARLGDLSREMAEALADGAVCAVEAGGLLEKQAELDGCAAQLRVALERIGEGPE